MQSEERRALMGIVAAVVVGVGVAAAGSQGSELVLGLPFFGLVVGLVYVVQWVAFIPAFMTQSERFFDITGSITYVSVTTIAVLLSPVKDGRSVLLMAAVLVWAVRLGTFLFTRVQKEGKDGRFDELKPSFLRFLLVWTLQGLWVTFTASAALVGITTQVRRPLGIAALVGFVAWLIGMAVEVAADTQKSRFRADPANRGRFISTGVWAWSRHPNYFGEIVLWLGVAIIAAPVLRGWQWVAMVSPVFVTVLLTRISGVPMLEQRADERWGGQVDYEAYKARTPVLVPLPRALRRGERGPGHVP